MNNATLGNTSSLPVRDISNIDVTVMLSIFSLILQLPVNIYILQLIISRHRITLEFFTFIEAIFELFICLYYILGIAAYVFPDAYLMVIRTLFVGFLVTGRPCVLSLICVERYLAVIKPVVFLRLKPLKYKVALSGIIWSWTLLTVCLRFLLSSVFHHVVAVQIVVCCVVKLYCCIACLLVLKQPGPGEGDRQKQGMNSIKLKAFRTILILTVSVILVYIPLVVAMALKYYLTEKVFLAVVSVCYTCTTFTGFVQALLILKRFGKLPSIEWL